MIYIIESLFVGFYCLSLYILLKQFNINNYYFLFIFGFLKHYLSYFLGVHDYYCNNGYACNGCGKDKLPKISNVKYLLLDSVLEGFLFIIVGHYIFKCFENKYLGFFVIGVFLHLFAELFFIHTFFCKHRCIDA